MSWTRVCRSGVILLVGGTLLACLTGPSGSDPHDGGPDAGSDVNRGPVAALAGPDLTVVEGTRIQLFGARSRSTNGTTTFAWRQTSGTSVLLSNPTTSAPFFVAPASPAELIFVLEVTDPSGEQDEDEVVVKTVTQSPRAPEFITLGADRSLEPGSTVDVPVALTTSALPETLNISATLRCAGHEEPLSYGAGTITFRAPDDLPCLVVVDGSAEDEPAFAPAALALWPTDVGAPPTTNVSVPPVGAVGEVVSIEPLVALANGESLRLTVATPTPLLFTTTDGVSQLTLPSSPTTVLLAAERRRGPVSGGVTLAPILVNAGPNNASPTVNAGPDRLVAPNASFGLEISGADSDDDDLSFHIEQVLGPSATPQSSGQTFVAPDQVALLIFHVRADDGQSLSDIDSVRVQVSDDVQNVPPVINQPQVRYVEPGATFRLDTSGATDPDSGIIAQSIISQSASDSVILLDTPSSDDVVVLTAGATGDVYQFAIQVFDAEGASALIEVSVIVEDAGPFVDAARGNDATGNGTPSAPFATVSGALDTAARHAFGALHLANSGEHVVDGALPAGLGLIGGFTYDNVNNDYVSDGPRSLVKIGGAGLVVSDAVITRCDVALLGEATAGVHFDGDCSMFDSTLSEAPNRTGAMIEIVPMATVALLGVDVVGSPSTQLERTSMVVRHSATVRLEQVNITPGAGLHRTALTCTGGELRIRESVIGDAVATASAVGISVEDCIVDARQTTVLGGQGDDTTGLVAVNTLLNLGPGLIQAATGPSQNAVGIDASADDSAIIILNAEVRAAGPDTMPLPVTATAVRTSNIVIDAEDASVNVEASATGLGLDFIGGHVDLAGANVSVSASVATGVRAHELAGLVIDTTTLTVSGGLATGLDANLGGTSQAFLSGTTLTVAGATNATAVIAADDAVRLEQCTFDVSASAGTAQGIVAGGLYVVQSALSVSGTDATAGVQSSATDGAVALVRSSLRVDAGISVGVGIDVVGDLSVLSSFIRVAAATGCGILASADVSVLHGSVVAPTCAVDARSTTTLDLVNSVLIAQATALHIATVSDLDTFDHCAMGSPDWITLDDGTTLAAAEADLQGHCTSCLELGAEPFDADGRIDMDSPVIDLGNPAVLDPLDIDSDARPFGNAPDIGCDEFVPDE